jgi:predicted glutamine amidotransferase
MCELLGLNFNQPVTIDISFSVFRDRGKRNPDGWGMASHGSVNYMNTHPFYRQLNSDTWVLAHNGTVRKMDDSTSARFEPLGNTDTELLFCRLLDWMSEQPKTSGGDFNRNLASKLKSLNSHGTINTLFTNGKRLYAYHDANGYNELWCLKRQAPFSVTRLSDNDIELNLGDKKNASEEGWIVATRPLTTENWNRINPGELMIFNSGKRVFRQG